MTMAHTPRKDNPAFSLEHQWNLFEQRCDLKAPMPEDQRREMRRAFFGALGQLLILMRDDVGELSEEDGMAVFPDLLNQVKAFWDGETARQLAYMSEVGINVKKLDGGDFGDVLEKHAIMFPEPGIFVHKRPNDYEGLGISIAGTPKAGWAVDYRGDIGECIDLLKSVARAMTHVLTFKNASLQ